MEKNKPWKAIKTKTGNVLAVANSSSRHISAGKLSLNEPKLRDQSRFSHKGERICLLGQREQLLQSSVPQVKYKKE